MSALESHLLGVFSKARRDDAPFRHWLLADVLPAEVADAVLDLPFAPPEIDDTQGKRETHNASRTFFGAENRSCFAVCDAMAKAFQHRAVTDALIAATGAPLPGMSLRIEYCQDTDGFWLEPHTDIGAKRFTMLIYLSKSADAEGWGTDIYDSEKRHLGAAPGGFNKGLIFVPGHDTWHGVKKRNFSGVRRSLIINYVGPEWRARQELAFPDVPVEGTV